MSWCGVTFDALILRRIYTLFFYIITLLLCVYILFIYYLFRSFLFPTISIVVFELGSSGNQKKKKGKQKFLNSGLLGTKKKKKAHTPSHSTGCYKVIFFFCGVQFVLCCRHFLVYVFCCILLFYYYYCERRFTRFTYSMGLNT